MLRTRLLPATLLALLSLGFAMADAGAAVPESRAYFHQSWQTEEGLPDNVVNDISQTPDGYLWLATLKGLMRFDGRSFRNFTQANSPGLRSSQVRRLLVAEDGTLWIGAGSGGVSALGPGGFRDYGWENGKNADAVVDALAVGDGGVLWITTWISTALKLENGRIAGVRSVEGEASRFNQWLKTKEGGLRLLSGNAMHALRDDTWKALWTSADGDLCAAPRAAGGHWMAMGRKLCIFDGEKVGPPVAELPADAPVRRMLEDRAGVLWLGTEGAGLLRYSAGSFERAATSHPGIRALFEDREGSLWVGTDGGGLNKVRERQIGVRDRFHGLPNEVVLSLCEDQAGTVWCLTQGGGVTRWPEAPEPTGFPVNAISICAATDGSVWVGTDGEGIVRLKDGKATRFRLEDGLTSDWVSMLCPDLRGGVLVGTVYGLSRFDGEKFTIVAASSTLREGVRALAVDRQDRIWAGSGDGALHCFAEGKHLAYDAKDGLPGAVIRCLLPAEDGSLWIGTDGGGLCRLRAGKITRWTKQQGLWEDVITQLQVDAEGNFWCGTQRGLFMIGRRQLDESPDGVPGQVESSHFGRSDGLPNFRYASEFHPRSGRTQGGSLLFATQKGVVVVEPGRLRPNTEPPNVMIEEMLVNDQRVPDHRPVDEPLRIAPGATRVEFAFAALSFAAPDKVRVRYRMEGLDGAWREADETRRASYFHLDPGSYRFHVTAANNDGVWNRTGAAVSFTVLAPFWQKRWFIALAVLGFAALVALLVRWILLLRVRRRIRRMALRHAVERERTRIARDLHDALGTSLSQVTLLTELAHRELADAPRASGRMQAIRATSQQMARALDEIVWSVSPANDDLEHLVGYISQFSNEYLKSAGIACEQEIPAITPERSISAEVRHHLFLAVKEALHNVVRHAHASMARITIQLEAEAIEIVIEDNGCGLGGNGGAVRLERGHGLPNLRHRLAAIGGTCKISSPESGGTRVRFHVAQAARHATPLEP